MQDPDLATERVDRVFLREDAGDIDSFRAQTSQTTTAEDWPLAADVEKNVLLYDGRTVDKFADGDPTPLLAEWYEALATGPGVFVVRGAYEDRSVIDDATAVFEDLIREERERGGEAGDHFATAGANDRVWNSLEKHCRADPASFVRYYANATIALASRAWLGPGYQVTAQVNVVRPGGIAQSAHRDYHLGFMAPEQTLAYPVHVHEMSPLLTLQGGVAHGDMPLESGPTMLLPYSQLFRPGYLAFGRPEYQAWFAERHVQLPLEQGDVLFFSPALMHGAGSNVSSDIRRMANLLQVSSPFGRSMESVDRAAMCKAVYPVLAEAAATGALTLREIDNAVASCAEGYPFPTNLDDDPPIDGLAPRTQQQILQAAVREQVAPDALAARIDAHARRR